MKTSSIRAFGVAAFAVAGLMVGCGGAPEEMAQQGEDTPVNAPAQPESKEGHEVRALYLRYQCRAQDVALRNAPGGNVITQVLRGEYIDVVDRQGNWMYGYHYASQRYGWTDATYYCV